MTTKLIYWPHGRTKTTKEELIASSRFAFNPWPKGLPPPISEEEANKRAVELNKIASQPTIYTEEQFQKLQNKPSLSKCYTLILGKHSFSEPIPIFYGFTPRFCFDEEGFKKEAGIDFLEELLEDADPTKAPFLRGRIIQGRNIQKARALAGTNEAYEAKKEKLKKVFNRLNAQNTEFVAFRSYRNFPATWDNVNFYSRGSFEI